MTFHNKVDAGKIEPTFFQDVIDVLNAQPHDFTVHFGWRSRDEQAALRAKWEAWLKANPNADPKDGPRAAKPEESAHVGENFPDGLARATDITLVIDGKEVWSYRHPAWQALYADVLAHPRLHSLHEIGDGDHLEKLGYRADMTPPNG